MESSITLQYLPELILYKICSLITCPFDLLSFGNTCHILRQISLSSSLWKNLAFRWFEGLWPFLEHGSNAEEAREWFLGTLRQYSAKTQHTKTECSFPNGEKWTRVDSRKFRFLLHLLRESYVLSKQDHPAILQQEWLYDIGLFRRSENLTNYLQDGAHLCKETIHELTSLSQAGERDLRSRKFPFIDHRYYVKLVAVDIENWKKNLFPHGPCPLLLNCIHCKLETVVAMCLSHILEEIFKNQSKTVSFTFPKLCETIKLYSSMFVSYMDVPSHHFSKESVLSIFDEKPMDFVPFQSILDRAGLNITAQEVCDRFKESFRSMTYEFENVADRRRSLHDSINEEIDKIVCPDGSTDLPVTRLNLTDCDFIGGDNSRQEMSCAAFISKYGVLVTWHFIGRVRY